LEAVLDPGAGVAGVAARLRAEPDAEGVADGRHARVDVVIGVDGGAAGRAVRHADRHHVAGLAVHDPAPNGAAPLAVPQLDARHIALGGLPGDGVRGAAVALGALAVAAGPG